MTEDQDPKKAADEEFDGLPLRDFPNTNTQPVVDGITPATATLDPADADEEEF